MVVSFPMLRFVVDHIRPPRPLPRSKRTAHALRYPKAMPLGLRVPLPSRDEIVEDSEPEREQRRQKAKNKLRTRRKLENDISEASVINLISDSDLVPCAGLGSPEGQCRSVIEILGEPLGDSIAPNNY